MNYESYYISHINESLESDIKFKSCQYALVKIGNLGSTINCFNLTAYNIF